jgi:tRNA(Arg) A34 adenosine deaminase TadA
MARALDMAVENARSGRGGPFAALIVKEGAEISSGVNLVVASHDPTAHAEIVAIREACRALGTFRLSGCEIYSSCEPCPMCLGAIYWAHVGSVFFAATREDAATAGFDDSLIYREIAAPLGKHGIRMVQMLREKAQTAFQEWQAKGDRIAY